MVRAVATVSVVLLTALSATAHGQTQRNALRELAFARDGAIYSIREDGSGLRLLVPTSARRLTFTKGDVETLGDDATPSWAPGGRSIVFSSNRSGGGEIWTMRPDGSRQRCLVGLPQRHESRPRVSPDGVLAFDSRDATGRTDVFIARADGSGPRSLAKGDSPSWRPG